MVLPLFWSNWHIYSIIRSKSQFLGYSSLVWLKLLNFLVFFSRDVHDRYVRNFSGKLSCIYTLLCYIYHLRTRDLRTKVGDTSGVILHRYDGIIISSIYSKKPLFLIKRTPQNGEKGHSHPIRRQNSRLRTGKYFENISDIWKKCIILDLCLFMFEKYTSGRAEARIKLLSEHNIQASWRFQLNAFPFYLDDHIDVLNFCS